MIGGPSPSWPPVPLYGIVLCEADGHQIVKTYVSDRQFGSIQHDGRTFTAKRMNADQIMEFVYVEGGMPAFREAEARKP